jgi:hypothetical protein
MYVIDLDDSGIANPYTLIYGMPVSLKARSLRTGGFKG